MKDKNSFPEIQEEIKMTLGWNSILGHDNQSVVVKETKRRL